MPLVPWPAICQITAHLLFKGTFMPRSRRLHGSARSCEEGAQGGRTGRKEGVGTGEERQDRRVSWREGRGWEAMQEVNWLTRARTHVIGRPKLWRSELQRFIAHLRRTARLGTVLETKCSASRTERQCLLRWKAVEAEQKGSALRGCNASYRKCLLALRHPVRRQRRDHRFLRHSRRIRGRRSSRSSKSRIRTQSDQEHEQPQQQEEQQQKEGTEHGQQQEQQPQQQPQQQQEQQQQEGQEPRSVTPLGDVPVRAWSNNPRQSSCRPSVWAGSSATQRLATQRSHDEQ